MIRCAGGRGVPAPIGKNRVKSEALYEQSKFRFAMKPNDIETDDTFQEINDDLGNTLAPSVTGKPRPAVLDPLRMYLEEIKRYPLLTREEEVDLPRPRGVKGEHSIDLPLAVIERHFRPQVQARLQLSVVIAEHFDFTYAEDPRSVPRFLQTRSGQLVRRYSTVLGTQVTTRQD